MVQVIVYALSRSSNVRNVVPVISICPAGIDRFKPCLKNIHTISSSYAVCIMIRCHCHTRLF